MPPSPPLPCRIYHQTRKLPVATYLAREHMNAHTPWHTCVCRELWSECMYGWKEGPTQTLSSITPAPPWQAQVGELWRTTGEFVLWNKVRFTIVIWLTKTDVPLGSIVDGDELKIEMKLLMAWLHIIPYNEWDLPICFVSYLLVGYETHIGTIVSPAHLEFRVVCGSLFWWFFG